MTTLLTLSRGPPGSSCGGKPSHQSCVVAASSVKDVDSSRLRNSHTPPLIHSGMSPGPQHLCQSEERSAAGGSSNAEVVEVRRRIHMVKVEVVAESLAGVDNLHEQYAASSLHRQHPALAHTPHLHSF